MNNKETQRMLYVFKTRNLIISLEPGWVEYKFENPQISDPLTFIKNEDGFGALQITLSTAENSQEFNIDETLKRNRQEYIKNIKEQKISDWKVYEYEDQKDNKYIKFFYLTKQNIIIFATY